MGFGPFDLEWKEKSFTGCEREGGGESNFMAMKMSETDTVVSGGERGAWLYSINNETKLTLHAYQISMQVTIGFFVILELVCTVEEFHGYF